MSLDPAPATVTRSTPVRPAKRPSSHHYAVLDGIRAIAIIGVFFFHVDPPFGNRRIFYPVNKLAEFGWVGVDLFFVLSGFLITGILIDTKRAKNYFQSFYARRVLRIFPLYYAVLICLTVASMLSVRIRQRMPENLVYNYLYLNNWTDVHVPLTRLLFTGHFWSLAVEEQFYLLWPLCVWLTRDIRSLRKLCIVGCLLALALRCTLFFSGIAGPELIYKALFTRMDMLLVGALCAIHIREQTMPIRMSRWWNALWLTCAFMAFGIPALTHHWKASHADPYTQTVGFSFIAITFGFFILWAYRSADSSRMLASLLRSKPLTEIGKYSYGMYVYHPLVIAGFIYFWQQTAGILHAATAVSNMGILIVTFVVAKLSYEIYEKRFLQLKGRFAPRY